MTVGCTLNVDHVGILSRSISCLVRDYRKLGFCVIGPAELIAVDNRGKKKALGQQSAHIMFDNSYVELTSVASRATTHHLYPFLGSPDGLRLLILRATDIESSRRQCADAGLRPGPIQQATREITYGNPGTAHFRWFALPVDEYSEALVCYVQHDTYETVFQREVTSHENGSTGLSRIILSGDRIPNHYLLLDTGGDGTTLQALSTDQLEALFESDMSQRPPFVGLGLAVADIRTTRQLLEKNGVTHRCVQNTVAVAPDGAGGVGLLFEIL